MQKSKSDLKKVSREFKLWRRERLNRRARIPDKLWRAAASLCEVYPIDEVRTELGIDYGKLKSKRTEFEKVKAAPNFITVDLPTRRSTDPLCEWIRPDGARLRVRVQPSQLNQVVAEFFGGRP